jgi:hypothetical protein
MDVVVSGELLSIFSFLPLFPVPNVIYIYGI